MKRILFVTITAINFLACSNDKKEDLVNEVPKNGSIETTVKVDHLNDSLDILTTQHLVYKNAITSQTILKKDTIPALGFTSVQDENANSKIVKKDYDIYITVK